MANPRKRLTSYSRPAFWSRIVGNVFLVCAGISASIVTPPSVVSFGITGVLGVIWVTMLFGGAGMAVLGMVTRLRLFNFLGPSLVIGSFVLWAISLISKPDATASSYTVAFVFLSFACMKLCLMFSTPATGSADE